MDGLGFRDHDTILVIDFGSQYTHLIIRRLHELGIYCDLQPHNLKIDEINYKPKGLILSGGPCSVYEENAPHAQKSVLECGLPVLGICYGMQELAYVYNSEVRSGNREYGGREVIIKDGIKSRLFKGLPQRFEAWMSHSDSVISVPDGYYKTASTKELPVCCFESEDKKTYAVQFHPEVAHTPYGKQILRNFADICEVNRDWSVVSFLEREVEFIRKITGDGHVICAVSGGVDSTVSAALMKKAVGDRFHAVLVDTGLLRLNEAKEVQWYLRDELKVDIKSVDASDAFIKSLAGITDPEQKRKVIGSVFIRTFEEVLRNVKNEIEDSGGKADFLMQGTLFTDVIESSAFRPDAQVIKSHHNVGGLVQNMNFRLIEPLRELFKDEVREMGEFLGISKHILWRHPFPGPGLGIRIIGEVKPDRIEKVRKADHIFISEIKKAGIYHDISQAFCVLLSSKSVGIMGDVRTYEETICLRAIKSEDFMTSECYFLSSELLKTVTYRIIAEVAGVNRVVFDTTTKPPSTIEWE